MRKAKWIVIALALFGLWAAAPAHGQLSQIVAANIVDAGGNKLASGTIDFLPVTLAGNPIQPQLGGGGVVLYRAATCKIVNGAITHSVINGVETSNPCKTADTALANQAHFCYKALIKDTSVSPAVKLPDIPCLQPSGATWYMDTQYVPASQPAALVQIGPQGIPGLSCLVGSPPGTCDMQGVNVTNLSLFPTVIYGTMVNADSFPGTNVGAKINAADTYLGANSGTIMVNTTGNVLTQVHLGANHKLLINVPLTWRVQDIWFNAYNEASGIVPFGSNTIAGVLKGATQTITTADVTGAISPIRGTALVYGTNVNDILVQTVDAAWSQQYGGGGFGTDTGNRIFMCATCSNIKAIDNSATNGGNFKTTSVAALVYRTDPVAAYNNVTTANSSYNVESRGNHCTGWGPDVGTVIGVYCDFFAFTYNGNIGPNFAEHASLNETVWGGAAISDWATAAGLGDPWSDTYHKAGNFTFTGGTAKDVQVGWFASMAHDVTFTGHTATTCNDICFDSEGSHNVRFVNINGTDGVHGEIYVLTHNDNVTYSGGTVNHSLLDSSHDEKMFQSYTAAGDLTEQRAVTVEGITFNCLRTDYFCDIHLYPMTSFTLRNNTMNNVTFSTAGGSFTSQGTMHIADNVATYTHQSFDGSAWTAIYPSTSGIYPIYVTDNKVITKVAQPSNSNAIAVLNPYSVGAPADVVVTGNITSKLITGVSYAWPNDVHVGATSMTGPAANQPVNFIIQKNTLGSNTVFAANTGCATGCDNVSFSISNGSTGSGKYVMSGYPAFDAGTSITVAKLSNPTGTPAGTPSTTGGTIAAGTNNYAQIVAVTDAGGQTLPGTISAAVTTTGSTSSITWTWTKVTGAYAYQVFVCDTAACTPSRYFTASSTSYIQTLPASSGTASALPTSNAAGGKVSADSGIFSSLSPSVAVLTDSNKKLVSATSAYGCADGTGDHLPCTIPLTSGTGGDGSWTGQTASLSITTVKTGLPAGQYVFSCEVNWTVASPTTSSSTLPGCFGSWTDAASGSTVGGNTSATNVTNSLGSGGSASTFMDVGGAGTISVTTSGYASSPANTAAYKLRVRIERVK